MRKLLLAIAFTLLSVGVSYALNSVISFTDQPSMGAYSTGYFQVQTEAPNPSLTILITDNLSHMITLSTTSAAPILYYSLRFNGTGTGCQTRLMHTATKASWVAYPVTAGGIFGAGINPNTLFINYTGCYN